MGTTGYDADIVIIGGGPGGYVAAIRAAQQGAKVILVEKNKLGGTCLNVGCIPTKAMIGSADRFAEIKAAANLGVIVDGEIRVDFQKVMDRKARIVNQLVTGVGMLMKKNKVQVESGFGKLLDPHTVEVQSDNGSKKVTGESIIIATGSVPSDVPVPGLDAKDIMTSDDALALESVPKSILIVGGGAIGLEFGYIYNRFGSKITVVEMMDQILPHNDRETANELEKILKKQGIQFYTDSKLNKVEDSPEGKVAYITTPKGDIKVVAEKVLRAVGRRPYLDGLGIENLGIKMNRRAVAVNEHMQTNIPNIYAIGDAVGGIQLAHVAFEEGSVAVDNIMGKKRKMDYRVVPAAVYTDPEYASVGLSEEAAKEKGYDVKVGKFMFRNNGKALSIDSRDGYVKVVSDKKYGEVLGVQMIGPHVTDLLAEVVLAMKLECTVEEIYSTIHTHPTLSEVTNEAAMDAGGKALHQ